MVLIKDVVARDIMVQPVECAAPDETLEDLEQRMMDGHVSGMPVLEDGEVVGFISKTDLVRLEVVRTALDGYIQERLPWIGPAGPTPGKTHQLEGMLKHLKHISVREAMRSDVITCSPCTPVPEIAEQLVRKKIHRIVVAEGKDIVGIVSCLDLARLLASTTS